MSNKNDGIYVEHGCAVTNNISSLNGDDGIELGSGCGVSGNVVINNASYGIWSWDGCIVFDNTSYGNSHGIYVEGNGSSIKSNTVRNSDESNIYVKGTDNAIEENLVTGSNFGIYFESSGNFYANNRASGNTQNFANTAGNRDGGGNISF